MAKYLYSTAESAVSFNAFVYAPAKRREYVNIDITEPTACRRRIFSAASAFPVHVGARLQP